MGGMCGSRGYDRLVGSSARLRRRNRCSKTVVLLLDSQLLETDSKKYFERKFRFAGKIVLEASASRHWRSRTHKNLESSIAMEFHGRCDEYEGLWLRLRKMTPSRPGGASLVGEPFSGPL